MTFTTSHFTAHTAAVLKICSFLLLFSLSIPLLAQKHTISGYVSDAESGEKLIGATVVDRKSGKGTLTNTFGFFSLTLPADSVVLNFAYIGYQFEAMQFRLKQDQTFNINLKQSAQLKEVEIVADKYERIEERAQMSRIDIPIAQIKSVPAFLGEVDVLRALQLLPGVSGGGEGQSGLYVRGGGPDQNLILLDGVPVYNASHLFGFFSVFNADAIKDVSLTKGGFPARYGGRLSSIIDITMKEGNENEFHGEGSIGLISSKLTLEGPIQKGKSSFIVSARRTYLDILARPLIKKSFEAEGSSGKVGYYFYDFNAKVNHRFSNKDRLYLSYYTGLDKFYLQYTDSYNRDGNNRSESDLKSGLGWGNGVAALRWNHVFTPKLFANTTLTYSKFKFSTVAGAAERNYENNTLTYENKLGLDYNLGIDDIAGKIDFDYSPNPQHLIKFGTNYIYHTFNPGRFDIQLKDTDANINIDTSIGQSKLYASEFAAYIEDDWKVSDRLRLNYGVHFSGFSPKGKTYLSAQPRFNARYLLNQGWAIKGAFSTMRQFIHLLTNDGIGLPTDQWLPTTDLIKPQDSWQVAIGVAKTFGTDYEFSVETYYKDMKNVVSFREGSSFFQLSDWQKRITQGDGTAYGTEFFLQKKKGRWNGWIGYTLSWAFREFKELNLGREFPYKYDRRHDFEILASYKISDRIKIAGTWVYATGSALTFGTSKYAGPASYGSLDEVFAQTIEDTPDRNNFRYQPYHRFDIGIDFTKQKRRHQRTWSFGAYNAYNRKNPFFLYTENDYDPVTQKDKTVLKQSSLFPIVPYFSYSFKF